MKQRSLQYKRRWFCYLDLLGFKNLVREPDVGRVINLYEGVVETIRAKAEQKKPFGISYSWFSDTFILFSRGDSHQEFHLLEGAGRGFFRELILAKIPVRGAISHGKLYSNLEKNVFIGEALIEAYEYGEKQNWIGFLLAPSVYKALEGTDFDVGKKYNYKKAPTDGVITHSIHENVFAYAFTTNLVSGTNPLLSAIRSMKRNAPVQYRLKYQNTERFIKEHANERIPQTAT